MNILRVTPNPESMEEKKVITYIPFKNFFYVSQTNKKVKLKEQSRKYISNTFKRKAYFLFMQVLTNQ